VSLRASLRGLVGGSALLLVIANVSNAGHFAFHVLMARLLGPAGYGALAAMMALLYVAYVLTEAAQMVMARYAAQATALGEVRTLVAGALRHGARVALVLVGVYLLLSIGLAPILGLPYAFMALFGLSIATLPLIPITRGALLGLHRFGAFGATLMVEVVLKLGLAAGAVAIGWNEWGAAGAVGISLVAAFAGGFVPLRDLARVEPLAASAGGALAYGVPVLVVTATVMAFYSIDLLLARALFAPAAAGEYAMASLLGRGILLGALPITRVMFPVASARRRPEERGRVLAATLALLAACVTPVVALVAIFPRQIVRLAGGAGYTMAPTIVVPLAAAMAIMAFSNTLLLFRLVQGTPRGWTLLPLSLIAEAALLVVSRGSLDGYARAMLLANAGFLAVTAALCLQPEAKATAAVPVHGVSPPRSPALESPPPPRE
jgi:O-antigen/teichoic acid export membrane protein